MSKYNFSVKHNDNIIRRIQQEIEDNFAVKSDVDNKEKKVTKYVTKEPKVTDMKNGDKIYYFDGTTVYEYRKINGKLYKSQGYTEV